MQEIADVSHYMSNYQFESNLWTDTWWIKIGLRAQLKEITSQTKPIGMVILFVFFGKENGGEVQTIIST